MKCCCSVALQALSSVGAGACPPFREATALARSAWRAAPGRRRERLQRDSTVTRSFRRLAPDTAAAPSLLLSTACFDFCSATTSGAPGGCPKASCFCDVRVSFFSTFYPFKLPPIVFARKLCKFGRKHIHSQGKARGSSGEREKRKGVCRCPRMVPTSAVRGLLGFSR